ncbi:MAG TPA: hypothetical protein VIJ25_20885, partial [Methylococcales bacterium]
IDDTATIMDDRKSPRCLRMSSTTMAIVNQKYSIPPRPTIQIQNFLFPNILEYLISCVLNSYSPHRTRRAWCFDQK